MKRNFCIPKTIHYCWFGDNSLPEMAIKCIESWEKYFPGYEIKEWNESNYDIHKMAYIDEAYNAKKYAFVSDYARFDILYQYGGIYFDTDVEVIKSFDNILKNGGFMGFESIGLMAAGSGIGCNAGLGVGCNAGLGIIYQILEFYKSLHFLNHDGSYNEQTVVNYVTAILNKNGLKNENTIQVLDGMTIYPSDYFAPKSFLTGKIMITENTYSIHHYDGSWLTELDIFLIARRRKLTVFMGDNIITKIVLCILNVFTRIIKIGIKKTLSYYINKYIINKKNTV